MEIVMKKRVMVAMSGGVDSSVCAALLINDGYEVIGATMWLFDDQEEQVFEDARAVCRHLEIEHHVIDLRDVFKSEVIDYFKSSYLAGLTPNPCAKCNRTIKFGVLFEWMHKLSCDFMATGHYAVIENKGGNYRLKRASTDRKDQVYFLHSIRPEQLAHLLFPLGSYPDKAEVRRVAHELALPVAGKKDSDGLCFASGVDYRTYLDEMLSSNEAAGSIVHSSGRVLGQHHGYYRYTVGQKRNLGIDIEKNECVIDIDAKSKEVVIGVESLAYHSGLVISDTTWIEALVEDHVYDVKMFNWGYVLKAKLEKTADDTYHVSFDSPVRAIAPGQYLVVYDGEYVLGGGSIVKIEDW
ncbi:tRNA 2-thiouridine(34) synthase MnmA [Fusibacter sp. A1]|nr:tRNA 2-thiouridine(34) synthase MnmA [Fusibacter sp. A1]